jgi:small subunit ribosomal protein S11
MLKNFYKVASSLANLDKVANSRGNLDKIANSLRNSNQLTNSRGNLDKVFQFFSRSFVSASSFDPKPSIGLHTNTSGDLDANPGASSSANLGDNSGINPGKDLKIDPINSGVNLGVNSGVSLSVNSGINPNTNLNPNLNPSKEFSNFTTPLQSSELPPTVLINCLRNNIFITVSSKPGHRIFHLSAGLAGFHGSQKTSPKAAMAMLDTLRRRLEELEIKVVRLNFRGLNAARAVLIGHLRRMGLVVTEVVDTTRVPFNGCRPPKAQSL